ncbi:acyl-CoA dehydrogenase family protein [Acetivibrio straminisolvens]|uniref:Butyryl-CoA dehydrogenase n=1 Tax=Acetivibrio straminisolvens JCM 21531 TaxID=1294263 RepID=W4V5P0_9FIRM|nr:acyl-CoA dehydrogenase family protein [Acetivibrio straminisolvens]GAE88496.1 butyryl-CoA dehydrogenase [Acetivibrio straminisolvens JCM 21531]
MELCSDFGLCGLLVSEEYSGAGFTPMQAVFSMEGLGYGCDDDGLLFAINNHLYSCTMPILKHGTKEQKERFLPKLATGEYIGAHAMTEPNSGSDSFGMNACAKENGDSYILNGNKCFITNAPLADVYIFCKNING